jgi:hypothetical protein
VTAPAAPLDLAVEEAERWVDEYGGEEYLSTPGLLHARDSAALALRSLLAALDADRGEAERLLREVSASGVEFEDERISYTSVQIDRETWGEVRRYFARREEKEVAHA